VAQRPPFRRARRAAARTGAQQALNLPPSC
jgi:hypothetical protein